MRPWHIALAYIAFSVLALALFAVPLWHAWRVNVGTLRVFVPEDMQALPELFRREGADAVAAAIRSRPDPSGKEVIAFAGPDQERKVIAGTLRAWPWEIPDAPGTYGHVIPRGDGSMMRIVIERVSLPGGYHLIMGRQSAGLMSLEGYFWYGMLASMVIVLALGGTLAWLLARRAQALRRSEQRYERTMVASNAGLWEWDAAADEYFFSPRALELLQFPPGTVFAGREDFLKRVPFHPEDLAKWKEQVQQALASGGPLIAQDLRIGDARRWMRVNAMLFRDGEGSLARMTGFVTDVTERKIAEDALRASEERYSLAMQATEEGHLDVDLDTDEMFVSERLAQIHSDGRGARFVKRSEYIRDCVRFYGNDGQSYRAAIEAAEADGGPERYELEFRIVRPSGEIRWLKQRGKVTRDAAGRARRRTGALADITVAKTAQEALRVSEERYALAVAGSDEGIFDVDFITGRVFFSPRAAELTGLPPDTETASIEEYVNGLPLHPEDFSRRSAALQAHLAGTAPAYAGEFRLRQRDGVYRWRRIHAICKRDADGRPHRMAGSISDVDARHRAEEALKQSEERYALAVAGSDDGVWDVDFVNQRVFISERARTLAGMPPGPELVPMQEWIASLPLHPEDLPRRTEAFSAHIAGKTPAYIGEFRLRQPDGSYRWRRLRGLCLRNADGQPYRMAGSISDIDTRRRAEDAARYSEERYALAMEAAQDAHFDWNMITGEYYVSPRSYQLYGIPEGTKIASREDFLAVWPVLPEDQQTWLRASADLFAGEGDRLGMVLRARVRGEMRWMQFNSACVRDAAGKPVRFCGSVRDVTDSMRVEAALRLSEERYALAMEVADEGHWDWNVQSDEIFASAQALRVIGVPEDGQYRTRSEITAVARYHPDDWPRISAEWRAALAGRGTEHEFEYRVLRGEEPRWIRGRWKVFRDADGVPQRVIGVVSDITERKNAADELRVSEARFRGLTALWSDWYWQQDQDHRFVYSSAAIDPPSGYPGGSAIGKTRWELDDIVPLSTSWNEHRKVLDEHKPFRDLEYSRLGRDGEIRYVSTSGTPMFGEKGEFLGYHGVARDITERKRALETLRESESRFRSLTQISSDWYWRQDENLRFTYLSDGMSERAGWSGDVYIGKLRWEVPDLHLISCSWEEHKEVLARRQPFRDLEYWRPGKDGPVYTSISGAPIFDGEGCFRGYQGVGRNITERKRALETLRDSEARYARAMDASADGLWEWNAATDELFISPRARELWGIPDGVDIRTRAELLARNLQFTENTIRECAAQRAGVEMTYSVLNQAGELRWIRSRGKVFHGERGEPMLVTGSLTDVTERQLAADALRLSEEELRARQDMLDLAQKAASAVAFEWHIGAGEGENRWSADLEAMYGLEPGSYDGAYETWTKLVFQADRPAVKAAIERANETGEVAAEYRVVHPGGAVRWLQARGRMFFDGERKPKRVVGFMLDVTDRHQAEVEVRRLERQLRQAQRLEAMGTLAGGIAHDFNNILGAILGYGEMALRAAAKGSRLARDLDSIVVAGERGRALVDRVLAFSRSGVGERIPVHVEKVVREALDLISAKLPPNVTLRKKLRAGRAAMLGDATQVHQVVMNLATNAVQAMPGGGKLRVSLDVTRLERTPAPTIGVIKPGEYLVLEVADSGTGIPPEVLEQIFDPFFTTKEVGTGTGLGLSLVHGIVTELGGAIDVASIPGEGSTFTVYLPRTGETVDAPQDKEVKMPRGEGQRVLVVDDEEPLVRLATRTLEELGYAPVGFTSSSAALAAFRADPQRFDALIADERMPGMSGSALIREVRGLRDSMPVVLMSGYLGAMAGRTRGNGTLEASGKGSKVTAKAGADEILQKPLSAHDLATSLARVLRL